MSTGRYIARGRGRAAACKCGAAQGITLVELLVVLTILGLMAAVAIPTFAKFGFFSRNETQQGARELYKMLIATRMFASTYRVDTGLAYGITLKRDSLTGSALEAIDAVAMVRRISDDVRAKCYFYKDLGGNPLTQRVEIPENPKSAYYNLDSTDKKQMDKQAYVLVTGEQERGSFRSMPDGAVLIADNLLPDGADNDILRTTVTSIRIYNIELRDDGYYDAEVVTPLVISDGDDILGSLPQRLQYLAALPAGARFLEYKPLDSNAPPNRDIGMDFRFPAHIFTYSGRMDTPSALKERFTISVGYSPDADPVERFVDPGNSSAGLRTIDLELYRGTGRVQIVREES